MNNTLSEIEVMTAEPSRASGTLGMRASRRFRRGNHPLCDGVHHELRADPRSTEVVACTTINSLAGRPLQSHFTIRELLSSDAQACKVFIHHLDRQDIRMRFASLHLSIDHFLLAPTGANEGVAFAALDAAEMILGVVNLAYLNSDSAEIAVIVRSDYKRRGIGRSLVAHAIQWAEGNGLSQVIGYVPVENKAVLALARVIGFQSSRWDSFLIEVSRSISSKPV